MGLRSARQSSSSPLQSPGPVTVYVSGRVNDSPCPLVVDTGSNRTVLRADVLSNQNLPQVPGGLCDVTGRHTPLFGPVEVSLAIGGYASRHTVYVSSELEERGILGLDYLQHHGCTLDLTGMVMTLGGTEIPLYQQERASSARAFRLTVRRAVTLPPRSETLVTCRPVGTRFGSLGMIEASPVSKLGAMVGRTLVNIEQPVLRVPMANLSTRPIRVRKGTVVGTCEPVDISTGSSTSDDSARSTVDSIPEHLRDLASRSSADLPDPYKEQLEKLLCKNSDVFSTGDHDLGCTDKAVHHIHTGEHQPVKTPFRRMPPAKRSEANEMVQDMAEQGIIEESQSPWSSALVLVRKKDGTLRCCVDYRALNSATTKDSYPLPRIDDTLDALSGAQWFSTLDLKSGYHQVPVAPEDRPKTAFSSGSGLWQFRILPFGLCNAPATFERLMETVLSGLHWKALLVYLDDVIVFGNSFEDHLRHLSEVFERFREAKLKLHPKKCHLFRREVSFLGHIVSRDGVKTDPNKISAVKEWPVPTSKKQLQSFLGLCSYYRRFVRGFAAIAAPLHALTKPGCAFHWDNDCNEAFLCLKEALTTSPVLAYPDLSKQFVLDTDASSYGIGAVLSQKDGETEHVIAYFSRTLSPAERNYCATRRELLAIVDAVRHFHHYVYGANFLIRTDHAALQWLRNLRDPEGQLARWLARLGQYDFSVMHRSGQKHNNADSLSRRPCPSGCRHCSQRESPAGHCRMAVTRAQARAQARPAVETPEGRRDTPIQDSEPSIPPREESRTAAGSARPPQTERLALSVTEAQEADPDLSVLLPLIQAGGQRPDWEHMSAASAEAKQYWLQWDLLRLSEGTLQRRWTSVDGKSESWLTVVPRSLRHSILSECHGSSACGHFGVKKTLQRLRQRFYWLGMRRDVEEWCRTCDVCAAKKGPPTRTRAPLQIYNVGAPMERIAIDIAGPLPVTSAGNKYILVAMDYFTKWPEAYPIPSQDAVTVANVLVTSFFSRFGVPNELHSDQGRNFESRVFKECCRIMGIRKTRTTPLHPESDGMVERFNRTLGQELAKCCRHGQGDWDLNLPYFLMAYRSAEHETTGYTPAHLMFGREMRLPLDLMFERPPDEKATDTSTEYAMALRHRLTTAHQLVRERIRISSHAMKLRHDAKASVSNLTRSDRVWLYNPQRKKGRSPKLMSPWEGPYMVIERLSAVTYRIQRAPGTAFKVVHVNRLWKAASSPRFSWSSSP